MNGLVLGALNSLSDSLFSPLLQRGSARLSRELSLPEHFLTQLLAIEDKRFMLHFGIDPVAITRALLENLRLRRMSHGASTITQQLYNIKFHNSVPQRKTLHSKTKQQTWAVLYSLTHSKARILAEYLNGVYWGKTYYGLTSAAHGYFDKDPVTLSLSESFFLCERIAWPNVCSPERVLELARRSAMQVVLLNENQRELIGIYQHFFACGLELTAAIGEFAHNRRLREDDGPRTQVLTKFHSLRFPMRDVPSYQHR